MGDERCYLARPRKKTNTVRRSVALPHQLVEEASRAAPRVLRENLNRLVIVALQEYVDSRKESEFEAAMALMAAVREIRSEAKRISESFAAAESDGL